MGITITSVVSWPVAMSVLAIGLLFGAAGPAQAGGPLNPLDFASLGAFPTAPGFYTINTSGTPTMTFQGGTTLTGVVYDGIAEFDFNSINIQRPSPPPFQVFTVTGSLPLALLSRTDATIAGSINLSAYGFNTSGSGGGNGATYPFNPGIGPGGGGAGHSVFNLGGSGGGGGGFGGPGGTGASLGSLPGGPGGMPYGTSPNNFKAAAAVAAAMALVEAVVARSRSAPSVP